MMKNQWFDGVMHCQNNAKAYVVLTVMGSVGSTPRAQGTKMVVTEDRIFDTIGGGQLEHLSIKKARELLTLKSQSQHVEYFPLGAKLAQCCGGATHVLFEVFCQHVNQLMLFGAGHVAQALVPIISQLPLNIVWVDSRQEMFDEVDKSELQLPTNVSALIAEDCTDALDEYPVNYVLVMTHDHQLDFELVHKALNIDSVEYLGLIGSATKAKRFRTRLANHGISAPMLEKLVCPVGITDIPGKRPIEVAVSIAGQLIGLLNKHESNESQNSQAAWLQTKEIAKLL
ncbi:MULTISPECIES: xanthine dehydrogenase accessory protein XdhC [Alteromonadaceae]|uniref:xanthine dehydrogenase accessory protein XdhC n=1 Tax=Alteromonadaceae TaxID=72275 RepID=UPI001C0A0A62|nr:MULTISPECIES: xanthine dehydrogenase accessory protein XdhC [Aliiglaciecola]MBU2876379.1 xanthine dehydrogenase accessory protein XdhC [Aliiglaciecola lipolytica]MDO6710595.1 xanthine dehydrogenase accessory protein XdhC [Aliiglaciecola sp. 2_MG-2023]MDO6751540.1 xanthine dehydrogenase accessory protein XdhC [Aliiglaciecola sp. 1_MG-2023]